MDKAKRVAGAIRQATSGGNPGYVRGTWQGAEDVDANLSKVLIPGAGLDGTADTHRFVPKGEHVSGLVVGDVVLCVGSPLCIIAKVVGDTSLAQI